MTDMNASTSPASYVRPISNNWGNPLFWDIIAFFGPVLLFMQLELGDVSALQS